MWNYAGTGFPAILLLLIVPGLSFALATRLSVSFVRRGLLFGIATVSAMILAFLVILFSESIWIGDGRRELILSYLENNHIALTGILPSH